VRARLEAEDGVRERALVVAADRGDADRVRFAPPERDAAPVGLELGGAPRNPKNLWPEPRSQSSKSDPLETKLKRQVCNGLMKLAKARAAIRSYKFTSG
jgi:hypothetical protein